MFTLSIIAAAATASKWLIAGKVMTALGTGILTVAPAIERMKNERR